MSFAKTNQILEELKDLARSMAMPSRSTPPSTNDSLSKDDEGYLGSSIASSVHKLEDSITQRDNNNNNMNNNTKGLLQTALLTKASGDDSSYLRRPPTRRPNYADPNREVQSAKEEKKQKRRIKSDDLDNATDDNNGDDAAIDKSSSQADGEEQGEGEGAATAGSYDREVFDFDGSIYDGVKTTVVFYNSEPQRFEQISLSMWVPEDVEEEVEQGTETELTEGNGDDDDECDGEQGGSRPIRRVARVRLPAFHFGGAITNETEAVVQSAFEKALRRARGSGRRSNPPSPNKVEPPLTVSTEPVRIAVDEFQRRAFPDAFVSHEEFTAAPHTSPVDFIVEVEPNVVFDAAAAMSSRRLELYRTFKETVAKRAMAETIQLRVIMDPLKTGFEEDKEFVIERGKVVASRFEIVDLLGKATFSRAVRAYDLHQSVHDDSGALVGYAEVCLKIINNTKEFFDQSLDEIRLLELINSKQDPDETHVVRLIDYFYFKEHMFIVTELLSDNLYDYGKFNREQEPEFYFTLPRLRSIAKQITTALAYIHSLGLMHCDLKPENVLFVSHRRCIVKVIDFGSSCFLSDHLSGYIQSRSYRAPEVIVGADYDGRIDVWSLGAILVEMLTGEVLFSSETVPEMLARIASVCGQPLPRALLWEGRHTSKFFNKFGCLYEVGNREHDANAEDCFYLYTPVSVVTDEEGNSLSLEQSKFAALRAKLASHGMVDKDFIDFIEQCLVLDHKKRPTSAELLEHPFLRDLDEEDVQEEE